MKIHIYTKLHEDFSVFDDIIKAIKTADDELFITSENKRSFRELEILKNGLQDEICIVSSVESLGMNEAEIATQLSWFIDKAIVLIICDVKSTYEFGYTQPMNQAVLSTVLDNILSKNSNIIKMQPRRSNSGRPRISFPDAWDDLYADWTDGKISTNDFIKTTGLKRATFYNLVTEYKNILAANEEYLEKYKII